MSVTIAVTQVSEPRAEERIARTITAVTGAAAVLLLVTSIGAIISEAPYLTPTYVYGAPLLVFGGFAVLVFVTFRLRLRDIRRAHGWYALIYLFAVVTWLPSMGSTPLPPDVNPWVLEIVTLGAVPAAIAWRASLAWIYLAVNSVLNVPIRYFAAGGVDWQAPLQYSLLTITLGGVFTALAMVAMRNAKAVDAATTILREAAARSAAASARAQEQTRLDALVHDEVMSTLFYASRGEPGLEESVKSQAEHALAQLERLRSGRDDSATPVSAGVFTARLRSVVLAASVGIDFEASGRRSAAIPAEVAAAFAEATSEAARNSLLHAPDATRSVRVQFSGDIVRVEVRDSGPGFDPREVDPHRLGIQVSIRGRMATLAGGRATVHSATSAGTTVTLEWIGDE